MPNRKLLLLEDYALTRTAMARLLSLKNFRVSEAATIAAARAALSTHSFSAAVLDLMVPDGDGSELIIPCRTNGAKVIVLTARTLENLDYVRDLHPDVILGKPVDLDALFGALA